MSTVGVDIGGRTPASCSSPAVGPSTARPPWGPNGRSRHPWIPTASTSWPPSPASGSAGCPTGSRGSRTSTALDIEPGWRGCGRDLHRRAPVRPTGHRLRDGGQTRDFLYVDDAVSGILAAAAAPVSGVWNVATSTTSFVNELLAALQQATGRALEVRHDPRGPGDVDSSSLSIDRIAAELGWRPAFTLADGIRILIAAWTDPRIAAD